MIFWQNLEYRNNESRLSSDWPLSLFALPHSRLPLAVYRARWLLFRLCYGRLQRFYYSQLWSLFSCQSVSVTFSCISPRLFLPIHHSWLCRLAIARRSTTSMFLRNTVFPVADPWNTMVENEATMLSWYVPKTSSIKYNKSAESGMMNGRKRSGGD